MSWQKIRLPYTSDIDPEVVKIGKLVWDCYERENKPAGFAMFHASRGQIRNWHTRLVYLTPVAAELCREVAENYTLEPCDVPARDEPDIAFVFGDPLMMGALQDKYDPSSEEAPQEAQEEVQQAQAATESQI